MAEPFNGKEYRQGLHAGYLAAESQDPVKPCPNTHRDFRAPSLSTEPFNPRTEPMNDETTIIHTTPRPVSGTLYRDQDSWVLELATCEPSDKAGAMRIVHAGIQLPGELSVGEALSVYPLKHAGEALVDLVKEIEARIDGDSEEASKGLRDALERHAVVIQYAQDSYDPFQPEPEAGEHPGLYMSRVLSDEKLGLLIAEGYDDLLHGRGRLGGADAAKIEEITGHSIEATMLMDMQVEHLFREIDGRIQNAPEPAEVTPPKAVKDGGKKPAKPAPKRDPKPAALKTEPAAGGKAEPLYSLVITDPVVKFYDENDLFQSFIKKPYSNVRVPNTVLRAMETQARSLLDAGLKGHERRAMQGVIDRIAQSRAKGVVG